jgi:hypothetical protein
MCNVCVACVVTGSCPEFLLNIIKHSSPVFSRKKISQCYFICKPRKYLIVHNAMFHSFQKEDVLVAGLLLSSREMMRLVVVVIFYFISHTMACQPEGLRLHIYSWSRQPAYAEMLV